MKINDEPREITGELSELAAGTVFEFMGREFMTISKMLDRGSLVCVELEDGEYATFSLPQRVIIYPNATLTFEGACC